MDEDQRQAFDLIINGHNLLLTGQAGTGKSFVIKNAVKQLRKRGDRVALTSSTGISASVFEEECAITLHKWAGLEDGRHQNCELSNLIMNDERYIKVKDNLISTKYLFIDEVSMISARTLGQVEFVCRTVRNDNGYFGGLSIILSGSFFQLPPVKNELYGDFGHYCFTLPWFQDAIPHHVNLNIIHRQSDIMLVTAVSELERGRLTPDSIAFLNSLTRPLPDHLLEKAFHLFARNIDVDLFNFDKIQKLPTQLYVFTSEDEGDTCFLEKFLAPKNLGLKIGIPVMLLVNLSDELVNGRIGTVIEIENANVRVEFVIGNVKKTVSVSRYLFTKYDPVDKIMLAKRLQFPLKPAYAVTVHKSQGMTLDAVVVDCQNATYPGQIGVAVGRVKSPEGLMVKNFRPSLVTPHPKAVDNLYESCSVGVIQDDLSCCKFQRGEITDENNNSDSSNSKPDNTKPENSDSDDDTLNYFDGKRSSGSEFSDIEPDLLEAVNEMEIPDQILDAFNKSSSEFHDTPIYEHIATLKTETLKHLAAFSKWYDAQMSKISDISNGVFQEGKTQFSAKDFHKFYTEINVYMQSSDFRQDTQNLAEKYASVDKNIAFQILTSMVFNLQAKELKLVDDRCEKDIPSVLEKISLDHELPGSARGKIRYISGYVVAKLKYRNSKLLRNSIFAPGKESVVQNTKKTGELLDFLCAPYSDLIDTTADPESLLETKRKQNKTEGLCNITDQCYNFFIQIEQNCRQLLTYESLQENRAEFYNFVEKSLLDKDANIETFLALFQNFIYEEHGIPQSEELNTTHLCASDCQLCTIIRTLFDKMICLFVKVSVAQFRRDFLSALKVEKSKALRKKVTEKLEKSKSKQIDMNFLKFDKSENKQAFHLRLKSDILQETVSLDKQFKKNELASLCLAYNIKIAKNRKKCDFIEQLSKKVLTCDSMPNPQVFVSTSSATEHIQVSENVATERIVHDDAQPGPSAPLQLEDQQPGPSSVHEPDSEQPAHSTQEESQSTRGDAVQQSDVESDPDFTPEAKGKRTTRTKSTKTMKTKHTVSKKVKKGMKKGAKGKGKGKGKKSSKQEESDDENCPVCYHAYTEGEDMICCDNCQLWYHRNCAKLDDASDWEYYTVDDNDYFCPLCQ